MRQRFRGGLKAAAYVCLATLAHAQTPQQPPATFRATVRLIVQPVTVKDKQGKPVLGLTAKDFVLTEDGQPQELAFVEYQTLDLTPASAIAAVPVSPTPATSVPSVPSATREMASVAVPGDVKYHNRRLIVLYFDLYRMPAGDQLRMFSNADKFVTTQMTTADMLAVMVFDGRGVRLAKEFTDDRPALREAIQKLIDAANESLLGLSANFDPGGAFGEDDDTFNLFATDRQLSALQTAVTGLAPMPELKTLVYFGSGLRLNGTDNIAQLRATVNAAIRANVTLNPIDTRGLVAMPPLGDATQASPGGVAMFSGRMAEASTTRQLARQDALYALAKDTGGRAMFDNNDLSLGIVQAANAVTGYYLLGYYTKNIVADGRYRRVKVSLVGERDAELSYRAGYYGEKVFAKFTAADKERQLADALRLEDPITEIPMALEVNYFQISSAEYFIPVSVRMPGSELARPKPGGTTRAQIDVIGEIKDEHGVTIQNARDILKFDLNEATATQVAKRPIQYETGFTLLPGDYVIKMLARDSTTGRIGTYQKSFSVPNLEKEQMRLPVSTVILASQRVSRADALFNVKEKIPSDVANPLVRGGMKLIPSVTRTFSASRPLFVFLQAFERDATAMRPLAAYVTLSRDGVKAFETETLALRDNWEPKTKAVPIEFTISLKELDPGPYDCQVSVLDPSNGRAAFWRGAIVVVR